MPFSPQTMPVAVFLAATGNRGAHAGLWIAGWAALVVVLLAGVFWWRRRSGPRRDSR